MSNTDFMSFPLKEAQCLSKLYDKYLSAKWVTMLPSDI